MRFEVECPRCGKKEVYEFDHSIETHSIQRILQEKLQWDTYLDQSILICYDCNLEINHIYETYETRINKIEERFDRTIKKLNKIRNKKIDDLEQERDEKLDKFLPA